MHQNRLKHCCLLATASAVLKRAKEKERTNQRLPKQEKRPNRIQPHSALSLVLPSTTPSPVSMLPKTWTCQDHKHRLHVTDTRPPPPPPKSASRIPRPYASEFASGASRIAASGRWKEIDSDIHVAIAEKCGRDQTNGKGEWLPVVRK